MRRRIATRNLSGQSFLSDSRIRNAYAQQYRTCIRELADPARSRSAQRSQELFHHLGDIAPLAIDCIVQPPHLSG